jgi:hypothetical protein
MSNLSSKKNNLLCFKTHSKCWEDVLDTNPLYRKYSILYFKAKGKGLRQTTKFGLFHKDYKFSIHL